MALLKSCAEPNPANKSSRKDLLFLAAEQLGKETRFNRVISVALATIFFSYALEGLFNVISTTAPGWLSALTTRCSVAHSFLLSELGLVVRE